MLMLHDSPTTGDREWTPERLDRLQKAEEALAVEVRGKVKDFLTFITYYQHVTADLVKSKQAYQQAWEKQQAQIRNYVQQQDQIQRQQQDGERREKEARDEAKRAEQSQGDMTSK